MAWNRWWLCFSATKLSFARLVAAFVFVSTLMVILHQAYTRQPFTVPQTKRSCWYSKAVSRLPVKERTRTPFIKNHPLFKPDPSQYKFKLDDKIIINRPPCANSSKIIMLLLSTPEDKETRQSIRQTWGSVQKTRSWPGVDFRMNIELVFVIGVREGSVNIEAEAQVYKDILQTTTIDKYSNLTIKVLWGLHWIADNCPSAHYVLKVDTDIFVNVPLLWQFLKRHGEPNSVYGYVQHGRVLRTGRWAIRKDIMPLDHYPWYASGAGYVISMDAVYKMLGTYFLYPYFQVEDVFITGILTAVGDIRMFYTSGFSNMVTKTVKPCEIIANSRYLANLGDGVRLEHVWDRIYDIEYRTNCIKNVTSNWTEDTEECGHKNRNKL